MIDMEDTLFVANSVLSEVGLMISTSDELVVMDKTKIEDAISERDEALEEFKHCDGIWEYSNE